MRDEKQIADCRILCASDMPVPVGFGANAANGRTGWVTAGTSEFAASNFNACSIGKACANA
jgi:hypothetical protein